MKPVDRDNWFWTPERLTTLFETLKELAQTDGTDRYFGPRSLNGEARDHLRAKGEVELAHGQIGDAIKILTYYDVLEPGHPSIKPPSYRRAFYPDNMPTPFTWSHIEQYREYRASRM